MSNRSFVGQDDGKVVETRQGETDRVVSTTESAFEARHLASMMNHAYRMGAFDVINKPKVPQRKPWFSLHVELGGRKPKKDG